ncbi:MAG: metallophosphoesterase [Spirochaetaceae bacterium]|nr:metallophosphoesterase [Spirochaetaceae bacterium]
MIYVTGDTHGGIDISKLSDKYFKEQTSLTKQDYLIIAGDFGFIWEKKVQEYWVNWFEGKNFTTLFVDGNHENFDLINSYKTELWNNGKIHKISNSIKHLTRGQIFTIDNRKIFSFGGARSIDKALRREGVSWWKEEMPSKEEYNEAIENLNKNDWKVDYIITHTAPTSIIHVMETDHEVYNKENELSDFLEEIEKKVKYKKWFFGHYHLDKNINNKCYALYQNIIKLDI